MAAAAAAQQPSDGHLSYEQFARALHLFSNWWERHCPEQPRWLVSSATLPVTGQVLEFAVMDCLSLVPAAAGSNSSSAGGDCNASAQPPQPMAAASSRASVQQQLQGAGACSPARQEPAGDGAADDDDDDVAVARPAASGRPSGRAAVALQYTIAYHDTYRVPVLYLRAMWPDGVALSLGEVMQQLPQLQDHCEPDQAAWCFITATAHPLLRTHCFMLHPCQTAERMALLLAPDMTAAAAGAAAAAAATGQSMNDAAAAWPPAADAEAAAATACGQLLRYLQAWLSIVARPLGLHMPLL